MLSILRCTHVSPPKASPSEEGIAYDYVTAKDSAAPIDSKDTTLEAYAGKVVLIVNVASKCGLTPQYEGLEALYRACRDRNLVVLGFPANKFLSQEPGTEAEIGDFCKTTYDVNQIGRVAIG
jgi:glutathione peroxidase-family protein